MRPVYVYKLNIEYPEGSRNGSGYRPYHWDSIVASFPLRLRRRVRREGFRWPRERMFLSASGANRRAVWLMYLGASVIVYRSAPVTWEEQPWGIPEDFRQADIAS